MFDAFRYRNYRLYWTGIILSAIGSWVQNTAQGWLVYDLTHSSLMLGTVGFLGALPVTLLTLLAGVLADRVDRRRLLFLTQTVLMASAFMMGLLTSYGVIAVWHVMVLATMSGFASAFDMPVRQSVVPTLVGKRYIMNAIALNSTAFNSARIIGPALAGILVPAIGLGKCFYFNSASYVALIAAVALIKIESFRKPDDERGIWEDFRGGLSYVRRNKTVRTLVCLAAVPSLFAMPYAMLMPVFAEDVLGVGIRGLGLLMSSVGVGGLTAALTLAMLSQSERKGMILTAATFLLPVMVILFANSRIFVLSQACLVGVGFSNLAYLSSTNSLIQTVVPDELRGRVVSAYMFAFVGMGPIGQLMMGAVAEAVGAPVALTAGGIVCAASAVSVLLFQPGIRRLP